MNIKNRKKIIVGMSGGIDSSVSAWILKQQGYLVEGLFMKNWEEDDKNNICNAKKDFNDAKNICDQLLINLHTINFSDEYWNKVFLSVLQTYKDGNTPNPDILCNKKIKFNLFLKFSIEVLKADYIATGHYARINYINNQYKLLKGIDINKDQSYFLYTLTNKQLSYCLFPVGEMYKKDVRNIAAILKFKNFDKKDSYGICFIGKKKMREFLIKYIPDKKGTICTTKGEKIGIHSGLQYFTIGQRKGLNIGGLKKKYKTPWYVIKKDIINNKLIVVQGNHNVSLLSFFLKAHNVSWVNKKTLKKPMLCYIKTRYRQKDVCCVVIPLQDQRVYVEFSEPIRSITPGQSVVFYLHEECLGGGIIE